MFCKRAFMFNIFKKYSVEKSMYKWRHIETGSMNMAVCWFSVLLFYMDKGLLTSVLSNCHTNKTEWDNWTKFCRETCIQIKELVFFSSKRENPLGLILVISSILKDIRTGLCIDQYSEDWFSENGAHILIKINILKSWY